MKSIVRKTKDNSGVTIIMALLFMLVCVLVSTVLLATAGTASRDVSRQREQQQAYLAVSSAIDLMKNDIENCRYIVKEEYAAVVDENKPAAFNSLLKDAAIAAGKGTETTRSFEMKCGKEKLDVQVSFKMTKTYRIKLTCSADDKYKMTASFATSETDGNRTWTLNSVSKGG